MNGKAYKKALFASLSLIYMLPFIQGVIMTVTAKDVMAAMNVSSDKIGVIGAVYLCFYSVSMMSSGMMAGRFGPRAVMSGMLLIAGIGGVLVGATDSFFLFCLGRALSGIGTAVCLSCSFTLFSRWYRAENYSRLCSAFLCVGGTGVLAGSSPLALVNDHWGWRMCFFAVGVLTLAYAALAFLIIRDWPPDDGGRMAAPARRIAPAPLRDGMAATLKSLDFWLLAFWFVGFSGIYQAFVGLWAVPYYKDVFGMSDAAAGVVLSIFSIGIIVGNPLLGWLAEKKFRSNRVPLGVSGVVCLLGILLFYLGGDRLTYAEHVLAALVLGMALNAPNTLVYASARNLFGARVSGMISGVIVGVGRVTGAAMQMLVSALLAHAQAKSMSVTHSYLFAFSPFFACGMTMAVCGFALSRASDPGRISPMSSRMFPSRKEDGRDAMQ